MEALSYNGTNSSESDNIIQYPYSSRQGVALLKYTTSSSNVVQNAQGPCTDNCIVVNCGNKYKEGFTCVNVDQFIGKDLPLGKDAMLVETREFNSDEFEEHRLMFHFAGDLSFPGG